MSKQPARKPLGAPPHELSGYFIDSTGGKFWVPSKPTFSLFRCNDEWQPLDPDTPLHKDEKLFRRALTFGTFTRINH